MVTGWTSFVVHISHGVFSTYTASLFYPSIFFLPVFFYYMLVTFEEINRYFPLSRCNDMFLAVELTEKSHIILPKLQFQEMKKKIICFDVS
jgi:hypothetical protein